MLRGGFEAAFEAHPSTRFRNSNNVKGSPVLLLVAEGQMGFNFENLFTVFASHVQDTTEFVMKLVINQNLNTECKFEVTLLTL